MKSSSEQPAISPEQPRSGPRISIFTQMVLALSTGVGAGLFFGEYCDILSPVGDAYVGLLQMTVLPYIIFSVVGNIGRLSAGQSRRLALVGITVMASLWALGFVTVWVLPMLVAAFTPFRYRDLMDTSRNVLITVFVIGSVFVVIPMLVESIKELIHRYKSEGPDVEEAGTETAALAEFIVPLAYPFPHLGKIVTLLFIPFAAWFYGQPMAQTDYPLFLFMGLFLSFGKVTTTIPFLLEMQELPADIFQLILMSSVLAGRFNDLLGASHLFAFTALTACAMTGIVKFNDMAHRLARDLDSRIVFVPFAFPTLKDQLIDDHFDIAMSGIAATVNISIFSQPSRPYMNVTMALVVRDHDRDRFSSIDRFRHLKSVKIGVKGSSTFSAKIREFLPEAKIVELWSESQFFEGPPEHMDALVTSAEVGSAWTLVHPQYTVVNPFHRPIKIPLVYLVSLGEEQGEDFLKQWIELKVQDGTINELYDYWILGRGAEAAKPRWNVARDLLHWID